MPAEIVALLRVVGLPAASRSGGKIGEAGDRTAVVPSQGMYVQNGSIYYCRESFDMFFNKWRLGFFGFWLTDDGETKRSYEYS